ncbi:hypothetical protein CRG98_000591 [Punica granatum]|uniref:Uncharacterized protein n=1 Tax=Punica granatum TaxID=22663 RepID=A0A2I0LEB2_PUNGR|nr:hypothetical protein CRG98_000591 [Punica granatum]
MLAALKAKSKLPFIQGTLEKPEEDDPLRERWESTIAGAPDAKLLWDDRNGRYSQGHQSRIYQIKSEICLLKQEVRSIRVIYGKMKVLWDEL